MPGTQRVQLSLAYALATLARAGVIGAIWFYRCAVAPLLVGTCRFTPSCSHYAEDAVRRFGPVRGGRLAVGRLLRCHPFSAGGWDPVPENWPR